MPLNHAVGTSAAITSSKSRSGISRQLMTYSRPSPNSSCMSWQAMATFWLCECARSTAILGLGLSDFETKFGFFGSEDRVGDQCKRRAADHG